MRVIAGEFRSRALKSVPGENTRPTPDRLRESLFNILAPRLPGCTFADLYAGTGAVGIEALSRGAAHAIFVDLSRTAVSVIRDNLKSLHAELQATVRQAKGTAVAKSLEADIVFLDPPYDLERDYPLVMESLSEHPPSLVIVQHDLRFKLAADYGPLHQTRTVRQGDNCLTFFEPVTTDAPAS
ncbi:MAG: 16S rRNA (guanine(966)-N(2))-methyltransferase RsmD [Acidobacteriota bacterium]